jgi:hypothetical protein
MSDDGLSDRRRASEEEYFRKRDQQLVEHLRIQAEREAARGRLSQRVGVADDEVLQDLETQRLGRYSSTRASASQSSTFATCSHNLPTSLRLQAGYSDSERFRRTNGQSWTALVANWNLPGPD